MEPFNASWDGDILRLNGELDLAEASAFEEGVRARLDGQDPLIVDVSRLTFIDSTGIRALVNIVRAAAPRRVVVRDAPPNVRRVLELTSITSVVPNVTLD